MSNDRENSTDELRTDLEIVARWGRYEDPAAPEQIKGLASRGLFHEAFELAESAAGPWPREAMFWFSMSDIAANLGLEDRAVYWEHMVGRAERDDRTFLVALFKLVPSLVASPCDVQEGMNQVIDLCTHARPDPDWQRFRRLDYDADVRSLRGWLSTLLRDQPPEDDVDGLWFGLFNPIRDHEPTADIYVAGGARAPEDREHGFPYQLTWTPEAAEAGSEALDNIYQIAYRGGMDDEGWTEGLGNDAEYPLCLSYASLAVGCLATTLSPGLLLGAAKERAIEIGFDSGDSLQIGTVTQDGLTPPTGGANGPSEVS